MTQPGALRGNFMCDSCGPGWQREQYVRMAPIANWPQTEQRQTTSPKQGRTISRRGKLIKNKTPAGNRLPASTGGYRTSRFRAHCPLILFAYPDLMLLLFDFYACRYFHFCNWIVIVQAGPRWAAAGKQEGKGQGSGRFWLVAQLFACPLFGAWPVPSSTRSHIEACQKWFCAWLALANTQRYTKWWTSTATPMPDTSLKRVVVACEAGRGKLEVVIHWQIGSIDAGTNTLLQLNLE